MSEPYVGGVSPHEIGSTLHGGYRVVDVKRGGMGVVYICHQESTNQMYALKTVRFDGTPEQVARFEKRFESEVNHWINVSRKGRCDQVVTALAFDADDRLLILEFIDGLSLHAIADEDYPVHPEHAMSWARDIAAGMRILHNDFRLVHRDLKPQNILVSRRNLTAKITDLGIGKILREDSHTGTLVGTPAFMPPESFEGKADFRSDIYAFGATLFWMLTGRMAHPQDGPLSVVLPPKAKSLLSRCLQADPAARYDEFDDLCRDLHDLDPVGEFSWDRERYSYCEKHKFHSPRFAAELNESGSAFCLFCAQEEALAEKVEHSRTIERRAPVSAVKARSKRPPPSDMTNFMESSVGASAKDRRAPEREEGQPEDRDTAPAARGRVRSLLATSVTRRWALAVGVLAVLLVIYLATRGRDPSGHDDPGDPQVDPRSSVAAECASPECENTVAPIPAKWLTRRKQAGDALRSWTSLFCATHSPWVCSGCGARGELALSLDRPCPSCGETHSERE